MLWRVHKDQLLRGQAYCPKCGEEIKPEAHKDNSALREILQLQAFCINRKHGCEWEVEIHQLEEHLETCQASDGIKPCLWASAVACTFEGDRPARKFYYSEHLLSHHLVYVTQMMTMLYNLKM